jgi:hypothetical protein
VCVCAGREGRGGGDGEEGMGEASESFEGNFVRSEGGG